MEKNEQSFKLTVSESIKINTGNFESRDVFVSVSTDVVRNFATIKEQHTETIIDEKEFKKAYLKLRRLVNTALTHRENEIREKIRQNL